MRKYTNYFTDSIVVSKEAMYHYLKDGIKNAVRPNNIGLGTWNKQINADLKWLDDILGSTSTITKGIDFISLPWLDAADITIDVGIGMYDNIQNNESIGKIAWDVAVDVAISGTNIYLSATIGAYVGSLFPVPGVGTLFGMATGALIGVGLDYLTSSGRNELKSLV